MERGLEQNNDHSVSRQEKWAYLFLSRGGKKRWVGRRGGKDNKIRYIYELFLSLSQNPRDRNTKFWGHSKHGFPKE